MKAVLETTDLDDAEEVLISAYMVKNVVRGKPAYSDGLAWALQERALQVAGSRH